MGDKRKEYPSYNHKNPAPNAVKFIYDSIIFGETNKDHGNDGWQQSGKGEINSILECCNLKAIISFIKNQAECLKKINK